MINLADIKDVQALQASLRAVFDGPQGKEVIKFLEQIAGWYDFSSTEPNEILIAHGKRQVLATIKTLLDHNPEQIVQIAKAKE